MPTYAKLTSQIQIENWTTIQHRLTGAADFNATVPSDGAGGAGPYLVFENGIWKYPSQATGGRIDIPTSMSTPVKILMFMADFGASVPWLLHVAGTNNTTNTPYPAADAAKYSDGDLVVASGTSRYVSRSFSTSAGDTSALVCPGQYVYVSTTGATGAVMRLTFARAVDVKS